MEPKPIDQVRIGRQVHLVRDLEVWLFAGGWGDGPQLLQPGAKLFLDYEEDGWVIYRTGGPSGSIGGKIRKEYLAAVEDDQACG